MAIGKSNNPKIKPVHIIQVASLHNEDPSREVAGAKGGERHCSTLSLPPHLTWLLYGCCKIKLNPEPKYIYIIKAVSLHNEEFSHEVVQ
jgi:hypothetical protein